MRVLILAMKYFPASGGSATYAHNLASGLVAQGNEVMLLAPAYRREASKNATNYKVIRMFLTNSKLKKTRIHIAALWLWLEYILFKPDVIWASSHAGCLSLSHLNFLRCPIIGTIHGGGLLRSASLSSKITEKQKMRLKFINRADAVVTVSAEAKKLIQSLIPETISDQKLQVIYNGIEFDPSKFIDKQTALSLHPEYQNKIVLLTVGRLVAAKGHDIVIDAVGSLILDFPNLRYVIVGEGPEKENLQRRIKDKKLDDIIHMTGFVDNQTLEEFYGLCDIFVMAGRETKEFIEGFGLVYIEASFRGKPVIGTRVGGIPEAIAHEISGLLTEPENIPAIAEAIVGMLNNPEDRLKFGIQGKYWALERFTTDIMGMENNRLITSILHR